MCFTDNQRLFFTASTCCGYISIFTKIYFKTAKKYNLMKIKLDSKDCVISENQVLLVK